MKYTLQTDNLQLSSLEHNSLDKKLGRLEKHLEIPYVIAVTLAHSAHHLKGDVITCRINVEQGKAVLHAERVGATIADTLDECVQALQQELKKHHAKNLQLRRTQKRFSTQ